MTNMCTVYLTVRNTSIGFCISNSAEWISVGYFLCWWLNQSHCGIISNSLFSPSQLELNSKHLYFRETFIKVFAKFSYSRQLIYILRKLYIKKYSSGKKSKYLEKYFRSNFSPKLLPKWTILLLFRPISEPSYSLLR